MNPFVPILVLMAVAAVLALGGVASSTLIGPRRYNRAMFDRHLRHRPQPLLNTASPRYPEVTIAAR